VCGTIKKIADGDPWTMPATIEDSKVLDEIGAALKDKGLGASQAGPRAKRYTCIYQRLKRA
jgi:hypothetical protein